MAAPTGTSAAQQVLDAALAKLTQTHGGERQALSGYTQDILGYLKGTPKAIGQDYQGAINQQNGFANQYAAQQRQANPNAQIQHDLSAINAPPEQIAALKAQLHAAYGGSAANLYALGGAIPNSAFAADKAGALAFAHSLPAIEGLRGQQLFQQLLANQGKESQGLLSQKADLLYKENSDAQSLAQRRAEQAASGSDVYGNSTSGYFTMQGGKLVPVPGYTPVKKNGTTASPSRISTTVARASKAGGTSLESVTDRVWASAVKGADTEEEAHQIYDAQLSKSFGSAMYRVIVAIGPHLKSIGYTRSQVKAAAYEIVSAKINPPKGYKVPSGRR